MSEKTQKPKGQDSMAIDIRERRFVAAMEAKGNAIPFINTFRELSETEKGEFYDDFIIRKKGRLPKSNPWWEAKKTAMEAKKEAAGMAELKKITPTARHLRNSKRKRNKQVLK